MGGDEKPKRGMNLDEWNYYCELCVIGDSEAVKKYMQMFEKEEQEKEICDECEKA